MTEKKIIEFDKAVIDLLWKRDEAGLKEFFRPFIKKEVEELAREVLREMGWRPSEGDPEV